MPPANRSPNSERAAALAELSDSGSLDAVGAGEFDDRQRIPDAEVDRKLKELHS